MRVHLALLFTAALAVVPHGSVAEPANDARIEELHLGAYWYGAPLSQEDLVGKVVLVELWGS